MFDILNNLFDYAGNNGHPVITFLLLLFIIGLIEFGYCLLAIYLPRHTTLVWACAFFTVACLCMVFVFGISIVYLPVKNGHLWTKNLRQGVSFLILAFGGGGIGVIVPYLTNLVFFHFHLAKGYDHDVDGVFRQTNLSWLLQRAAAYVFLAPSFAGWLTVAVESPGFYFLPHWLDITVKFLLFVLSIGFSLWVASKMLKLNLRAYKWTRKETVDR